MRVRLKSTQKKAISLRKSKDASPATCTFPRHRYGPSYSMLRRGCRIYTPMGYCIGTSKQRTSSKRETGGSKSLISTFQNESKRKGGLPIHRLEHPTMQAQRYGKTVSMEAKRTSGVLESWLTSLQR